MTTAWSPAIRAYSLDRATRGDSPRSIAGRESALRRLAAWCDAAGLLGPDAVTASHLEAYRVSLLAVLPHAGTRRNHLTVVKVFFRWRARRGAVIDPAAEMELPKPIRPLPRAILDELDLAALRAAVQRQRRNRLRDRALLETLYATGIRRTECVHLTIGDVDHQRRTLTVRHGKGRRQRVVPIAASTLGWIAAYRRRLQRHGWAAPTPHDPLFHGRRGRPLSAKQLSQRFRDLLDAAGIQKPGASHLFRHAMATHMLDNGADVRFIQEMLGHADISTTMVYTRVSIGGLAEVYRRTHPSAREGTRPFT
jgi:integrase/recombinase XerD